MTFKILLISLLLSAALYSQDLKSHERELLKQADVLLQQYDYEKAVKTLILFQSYVEDRPRQWLPAQYSLCRISIDRNELDKAQEILKKADETVKNASIRERALLYQKELLQAELYQYNNEYLKAEKLYRRHLKEGRLSPGLLLLADNIADRCLSGLAVDLPADVKELDSLIERYSKAGNRNQLDLIRLKNKRKIIQNADIKALGNLKEIEKYWMPKDELGLLKIYILNRINKPQEAFKVWKEYSELIDRRSHPSAVTELTSVVRALMESKEAEIERLAAAIPKFARTKKEMEGAGALNIELLITRSQPELALEALNEYVKQFPEAKMNVSLRLELAASLMDAGKIEQAKKVVAAVPFKNLSEDSKAQFNYVKAQILEEEGAVEESAALYLRVGQTAVDENLSNMALFRSGAGFRKAGSSKKAVIGYKLLVDKKLNEYTDKARFALAVIQADNKDYAKAVENINILAQNTRPESSQIRKEALFLKGGYFLKMDKVEEAIKAYEDYTVVYDDDRRNADVIFKVYEICRSNLRDLDRAQQNLKVIIDKWRQISPGVYADALYHSALISNLKGNTRETTIFLQQFLEFTQKTSDKRKNHAKLLLAAAYQNSAVHDSAASASLYTDVITSSQSKSEIQTALVNLLSLDRGSQDEQIDKAISKLMADGKFLDPSDSDLIFNWKIARLKGLKAEQEERKTLLSNLIKETSAIDSEVLKSYWKARFLLERGNVKGSKEDWELALKEISQSTDSRSLVLRKDIFLALKMDDEALNSSLQVVYSYLSKMEKDNYQEWDYFHNACLSACDLLISSKQYKLAENLINRLKKSSLSGTKSVIEVLSRKLEGAEK